MTIITSLIKPSPLSTENREAVQAPTEVPSQDQTIKPVDISTDSKCDQSSNGVDKNHTNFDCIYSNEVDFVKDV